MRLKHATLFILALLLSASANATTYLVDRVLGQGTITGYIETDDTVGPINFSNFVDYHLEISGPNFSSGSPGIIDMSTSPSYLSGTSMSATADELLFDTTGSGFIIWWTQNYSHFWCIEVSSCNTGFPSETLGYTTVSQANTVAQPAEFAFASAAPAAAATSIPTMSAYGLALTTLGLLLVATRRLRASAKRS